MRGILVLTDKTYRVLDVESVAHVGYYIGGFIVCEALKHAYLEERMPRSVHLIRKELRVPREHLKINSYATLLLNQINRLDVFVLGTAFITEKENNEFVDLNDENINIIKKDLDLNGYKELLV